MNCLFLTLKGEMRSWGTTSIGDDRWTDQWPSASAILGLTGACMGVDHNDPEQVSSWYNGFLVCSASAVAYKKRYGSRQKREYHPAMESDYQTIRNSLNMNGKRRKDTIVSHRGYIADGLDVTALVPMHNDAELWLEQLVFAVQQPHFTPYLGRRAFPLSAPLVKSEEKVEVVNSVKEICERMVARLARMTIGDLQPARCKIRIPVGLLGNSTDFTKEWLFAGEDVIADGRPGYLRSFKGRKVCNFYCEMNNE